MHDEHTEAEALADQLDGDELDTPVRIRRNRPATAGQWRSRYTKRHAGGGKALTGAELAARKGKEGWCQCCYKRRVNPGYKFCFWCA